MKANPLIGKYSWVGLLNIFIIQWLFIRIQISVKSKTDRTIVDWNIIGFILPLTGWFSKYIYVYKIP